MNEQIIKEIQNMKEDDFTRKIVMKIFKYISYDKVIYNGGVNEYGRDIILWGKNKIGNREVAVAQVKMDKLNSSTQSGSSFITVANQLSMALNRQVPHEDGNNYSPVDVYFVSPQQIDTRQLEMANGILSKTTELHFIDLTILLELIDKYNMQEYVYNIFNKQAPLLQDHLFSDVHNDELTRALAISDKKDEKLYYSDLDLSFLNFNIKIKASYKYKDNILITIKKEFWKEFKFKVRDEVGSFIHFFDFDLIESNYEKYYSINNNNNINLLKTSYINLISIEQEINNYYEEYDSKDDINNENLDILKKIYLEIRNHSSVIKNIYLDLNTDFIKIINLELTKIKEIINIKYDFHIKAHSKINNDLELSILKNIIQTFKKYIIEFEKILNIKKETIEHESYYAIINWKKLEKYLNNFILNQKNKLNISENTISTIKIINAFKIKVFQYNEYIQHAKIEILLLKQNEILIINKKISDLINSKINLLIEANAGAGKTTSLQHYSKYGDENLLKIYLPLTKIAKYIDLEATISNKDFSESGMLFNPICSYINKLNNTHIIDPSSLQKELIKDTTVLLFDGVDEVISKHTWIFKEIQNISNSYNCTVIATTRPSFLDNGSIQNFMKLKLLDFTSKQRKKFILGWFDTNNTTAMKLLKHIKENAIEHIISNPFAATIFCRLAERDIPLPTTETDMYEERLRLLLGGYDEYKNINRNNTYRLDLEKVATKVAFIFHKKNTRSMNLKSIMTELNNSNLYIGERNLEKAVIELVQPSNILLDEYDDGELTFGHFRYQEYLVAKELQRNRGIDIFPYLENDYWKGALSLFAQITDDMIHIFDDLVEKNYTLTGYESTLLEMASKRRNPKEKEMLIQTIKQYAALEDDLFFKDDILRD